MEQNYLMDDHSPWSNAVHKRPISQRETDGQPIISDSETVSSNESEHNGGSIPSDLFQEADLIKPLQRMSVPRSGNNMRIYGIRELGPFPNVSNEYQIPFRKNPLYECVFCKGNDQPESVFKSHPIRINDTVICPFLRKYVCAICGATGDNAHTIKYCPHNQRGFFASRNASFSRAPCMVHQAEDCNYHTNHYKTANYFTGASFSNDCNNNNNREYDSNSRLGSMNSVKQSASFTNNNCQKNLHSFMYPIRNKASVVRKLNFDIEAAATSSPTNNVFFKNLQKLQNHSPPQYRS